jgi:hypothetical protein
MEELMVFMQEPGVKFLELEPLSLLKIFQLERISNGL